MAPAPRSGCAINAAVVVLGDPWAILVLRDIIFGNRRHFRELLVGSEEGIATNILASRLKRPVAAGLLSRDAARRGQRVAYSLTEAGIQVLPVMVTLGNWGLAPREGEHRLRVPAALLGNGGPDQVAAMVDELRELHLGVPRPDADAAKRTITRRLRGGDQRRRQRALCRHPTLTPSEARHSKMEALHTTGRREGR
jgi:DNA-binding HxlR family transcriptional regulator